MKLFTDIRVSIFIVAVMISGCSSHQYDQTLDNQITAFQIKSDQQFVAWTAQAMANDARPAASVAACKAAPVTPGQSLSLISRPAEPDSQFFNSVETDLTLIEARTKTLNNNPAIDQQMYGIRNIFYQIKYKRQHCSQQDSPAYISIQRKQVTAILQAMLTYQLVLKNGSGSAQN